MGAVITPALAAPLAVSLVATIAFAARLAIAAVLAEAACHALRDLPLFAAVMDEYRLLPRAIVPVAAHGLPVIELGLAVALCRPGAGLAEAAAAIALLGIFSAAIGINLKRGRSAITCGCGGGAAQALSMPLLARNLLMAALLLPACLLSARAAAAACLVTSIGFAAVLATLYFAASQLIANRAAFAGERRARMAGRRAA